MIFKYVDVVLGSGFPTVEFVGAERLCRDCLHCRGRAIMIDEKQNRYVGREHCTVVTAYVQEMRPPGDVLNPTYALFFLCIPTFSPEGGT